MNYTLKDIQSGYELNINLKRTSKELCKEVKSAYYLIVSNYNGTKKCNELLEHKVIKADSKKKEHNIFITIPSESVGKVVIELLCEEYIGLDQCIVIPDIEEATGKECKCDKTTFDLPESKRTSLSAKSIHELSFSQIEESLTQELAELAENELNTQEDSLSLDLSVKGSSPDIEGYLRILGMD